jgi:ribosome maturation factor RimP
VSCLNRKKLDEVISLVSSLLESQGLECLEVDWLNGERILRLYVDRLDGSGIDLEGCVRASRQLEDSAELDALFKGDYTLEVSSPGVERPLRARRHFEREIGKRIEVRLSEKVSERWRAHGRLAAVRDADSPEAGAFITMETEQGVWSFPLASLQRAHVVHEWGEH